MVLQPKQSFAWKLRKAGMSQAEIAERMNAKQPAVSRLLKRAESRIAGFLSTNPRITREEMDAFIR